MPPLSAIIITKNEEDRVAPAILSAQKVADEVIVVDSGSADRTVEIAQKLGAKVIYNAFEGYGQQKRFAEDAATHDWLINIDADDRIQADLATEILALFHSGKIAQHVAYNIKIKEIFVNQSDVPVFGKFNKRIRLYNKKCARFNQCEAHDLVHVNAGAGTVGTLSGVIETQSLRSWHHALEKINDYSDKLANVEFKAGRFPSNLKIIMAPFVYVLKALFLKRYISYGIEGYLQSYSFMFLRLMKYAKTREKFLKSVEKKSKKTL